MKVVDNRTQGVMSVFTFQLRVTRRVLESFNFHCSGQRRTNPSRETSLDSRAGCGRTINWSEMRIVDVPPEFQEGAAISTSDVPVVPRAARGVAQNVGRRMRNITQHLRFGNYSVL